MTPVVWLNPHDLILVRQVQRSPRIGLHREVEHYHARLELVKQRLIMHAIVRCDKVCATEPKLWGSTTRDEDGGIVDCNRDNLFMWQDQVGVPEWCREFGVSAE